MRGAPSIGRLRHRVGEAIAAHGLWGHGDRVAVAVSGGLDSICLLDLLVQTAAWHGGRLRVVTVDHGLHEASAAHAAFVAERAAELDLACTTIALDLPDAAEATCREARYAAFEALAVDRVALAHHQGDQAETLLLQLLRGSGSRGLAAMRRVRGRYVRPLLEVTRSELEDWAAWRGLRWVEDPTNTDPRYLRNRLRRDVLPLLERLRPGAEAAIARSANLCAEDDACLERLVPVGTLDRSYVAEGPPALVSRALRRAFPGLRAAHVEAVTRIARRGSGRVGLDGGRVVEVVGEQIVARTAVEEEDIP